MNGTWPVLVLDRLVAGYGRRQVLDNVSLTLAPGCILGVIGPNGSGKSTLIRAITGVITPTSGRVLLDGHDTTGMSAGAVARLVAVVPQLGNLPDSFTGLEMALLGRTPHLRLLQHEGAHDRAIAARALAQCDAVHLAGRLIGEMSGGERQRVLMARALTQQPRLLLLDEPTSHLDLTHQAALFGPVRDRCAADGLAALVVIHDLTLAAQCCDSLVLLADGRVAASGRPEEVLQPSVLGAAYGSPVDVFAHPRTGRPVVLPVAGAIPEEARRAGRS